MQISIYNNNSPKPLNQSRTCDSRTISSLLSPYSGIPLIPIENFIFNTFCAKVKGSLTSCAHGYFFVKNYCICIFLSASSNKSIDESKTYFLKHLIFFSVHSRSLISILLFGTDKYQELQPILFSIISLFEGLK